MRLSNNGQACIVASQMPRFVELVQVVAIHFRQIQAFGGSHGIRDQGLLESALAQPQLTFGNELLHSTIYEQAAAYLFHLAKNHPFIDGNKRTAFAVMLTFLGLNGYQLNTSEEEAFQLVLQMATGELPKDQLALYLAKHIDRIERS